MAQQEFTNDTDNVILFPIKRQGLAGLADNADDLMRTLLAIANFFDANAFHAPDPGRMQGMAKDSRQLARQAGGFEE